MAQHAHPVPPRLIVRAYTLEDLDRDPRLQAGVARALGALLTLQLVMLALIELG